MEVCRYMYDSGLLMYSYSFGRHTGQLFVFHLQLNNSVPFANPCVTDVSCVTFLVL
jgi:hypothetical protein